MREQCNLRLLLLCAVLTQGIAALLNENIEGSSDFHIRQKRVVDLTRNGGLPQQISRAPYIVNVLRDNISECAASILSNRFLITIRRCVFPFAQERYSILSGSPRRDNGTRHNIARRIVCPDSEKIVIVEIYPPINFRRSPNRIISLFAGIVHHPAYGTFSGWGCTQKGDRHEHIFPAELRQTRLPIIPLEECIQIYGARILITIEDICTLDPSRRRGVCLGDEGGPLVYNDRLLGMMSNLRGLTLGEEPDVFVNLNLPEIHEWVTNGINNHFHH